jgi:putative transposase
VRFAFIETEKAGFPVALLCRMLAVSRAGFYAWRRRPVAVRTRQDQVLAVAVATIYAEHHGRYGSPRVQMELRDRGQRSGRKRIARLMRVQDLRARPKRRYRTTTDSRHGLPVCPNLLARRFTVAQSNTAWVTDITYIWTPQGWLYLAVVIDLFSRRVVGWSMSERIDRKLALDALRMALAQRRPQRGLIHHSDRGSPYASGDYQRLLATNGIVGSMSRRGDCWDNAVAESFFASLKLELVYQVQWQTRAEARTAIFEYLELFYNRRRRHSSLGYLNPVEFERRNQRLLAA